MKLFEGKVAVVTGGTRGIGRAVSLSLARRGAKVWALYARDRKNADSLQAVAAAEELPITSLRGDLTDEATFQAIAAQIRGETPQVNFIVHSAASGVHRNAIELTPKHLRWTFDINVFAAHQLVRTLVPHMPEGGRIIGITSSGGTRVIPHYAAVGSSKGAIESLFRHYAFELAPRGIAVNCVCPGLVLTEAVDAFPDRDKRIGAALANTPTAKLTTPEEVSELVAFLCGPYAGQIVGQTLVIDGGKTLLS